MVGETWLPAVPGAHQTSEIWRGGAFVVLDVEGRSWW